MQMVPRFMTGKAGLLALVLGGFLSAAAWAGELPSRFTLGKYGPGDVWIYLHEAKTPQRAWIDKK